MGRAYPRAVNRYNVRTWNTLRRLPCSVCGAWCDDRRMGDMLIRRMVPPVEVVWE